MFRVLFLVLCVASALHQGTSRTLITQRKEVLQEQPLYTVAPTESSDSKASRDFLNRVASDRGTPPKSGLFVKYDPCPPNIKCVPPIQCPAHVTLHDDSKKPLPCELADGTSHGLCCTTGFNHSAQFGLHPSKKTRFSTHLLNDLEKLMGLSDDAKAKAHVAKRDSRSLGRGSPEFFHNLVFQTHPGEQKRFKGLSDQAMTEMLASKIYREEMNILVDQFQLQHHDGSFVGLFLQDTCDLLNAHQCPHGPSRFRATNGACNNNRRKDWGAAGTAMGRILAPVYVDGVWSPRTFDTLGQPLPSARDISRTLFPDVDRPHPHLNIMVMQFGQFIAHDVTQSASITDNAGRPISCCTANDAQPISGPEAHFACMAIPVRKDDEFYGQFGRGCINFVRSALAPNAECRFNYGQQISKVTHFLDGSMIYGSDDQTEQRLRENQGGRLRMFNDFHRELLPVAQPGDAPDECTRTERPDNACFVTGDIRTNQIISLTSLHLVFAREHNRVASILAQLNPSWPDELVYREAKRVVVAQLQLIAYREWLPLIIGSDTMQRFGLNVRHAGHSHDYDAYVNPSVTSEFTTSAFRFGHSTVDGKLRMHHHGHLSEIIDIPDVMFNPNRLRFPHFYDEMLRTMLNQPMQEVDSSVSKGLSQNLFRGGNPFGLDLVAINIQRGRDHGIRPYNDYLEVSGAPRISHFGVFGSDTGHKLSRVYATPDDIDLWVGGLMEQSRGNALVGPTFADIIADQFYRLRVGDRYFFEHGPHINPGAFTEGQLAEIRKTSLARIICDNADHIRSNQPNAFMQEGVAGNHPVPCQSIPGPDFIPWRV